MKIFLMILTPVLLVTLIWGILFFGDNKAYECLSDGGLLNKYDECVCDGYSDVGECLNFVQNITLVEKNGSVLVFQGAGSLRGIRIDGKALDLKIIENEQGLSFYSEAPRMAIFLPRTVAIGSVDFIENDCRFKFTKNVITEDQSFQAGKKTYKIRDPKVFSVDSVCNQELINSYTIDGGLGVLDVKLADGRHFQLKTQE
ncbi:MAG: hypothetical protein COA60_009920 [Robiginitomaculum sp.]|nr:hypothetical protein [Robiginitomaculum sp.]